MSSTMPRIMAFDHLGASLGDLDPSKIIDATYVEEVNGENSITVTTLQELEKTTRLLLRDEMGYWHEYVVCGMEEKHLDGGAVAHKYWCPWSLQYDLSGTYINDQFGCGIVPGHASVPQTARKALECALDGTLRWGIGTITVTTQAAASFYCRSGWEGIETVLERWGGELSVTITAGNAGVTSRAVNLLAHVGAETATRRFDYGADVKSIRRVVSDDIWPCRIVPLGKSQETDAGGYTRRPSIESVNGGIPWVEDSQVVPLVRMPDGYGGYEYPTAIVKNDTYEDPSDLKTWALAHVSDYTRPKVSYEAQVAQFVRAGMDPHGVALGDEVVVVDRDFLEDGLRISARVIKIKGSLLDPADTQLTISSTTETLASRLKSLTAGLAELAEQTASASQYQATADYLSALLGRLNDEANTTGGYTYITEGEGIRTYDAPVSDPLVGSEASKVVEVKGGTIRIANTKDGSGNWNWRTVFVSGLIATDVLTASNVVTGIIEDAAHKANPSTGNYWDLDTGELRMAAASSYIGDQTIEQILDTPTNTSNLVRNGDFQNGTDYWTGTGTTRTVESDSTFGKCLKAVQSGAGGSSYRTYPNTSTNFGHEQGKTYSLSFWAKANAANTITVTVGTNTAVRRQYVSAASIGTSWKKFTGTVTTEDTSVALSFWLGSAGTLYLADVMLVYGSRPAEYVQSPSDFDQSGILYRLTNGYTTEGLYISGGHLYINADAIRAGELSANRIYGGTLKVGGQNNANGIIQVLDSSGNVISQLDNTGANITGEITNQFEYSPFKSTLSTKWTGRSILGTTDISGIDLWTSITGNSTSSSSGYNLGGLAMMRYSDSYPNGYGMVMLAPPVGASKTTYWSAVYSTHPLRLFGNPPNSLSAPYIEVTDSRLRLAGDGNTLTSAVTVESNKVTIKTPTTNVTGDLSVSGNITGGNIPTVSVSSTTATRGSAASSIGTNSVRKYGKVVSVTLGSIQLASAVANGDYSGTIATVPSGYRPATNVFCGCGAAGANLGGSYVRITTAGVVAVRNQSGGSIAASSSVLLAFTLTYVIE